MFTGKTPDITPAQVAALLTFAIGQLVAFGLLDKTGEQSYVSIGSAVLAVAWKLADAYLRGQRAAHLAKQTPPTPAA